MRIVIDTTYAQRAPLSGTAVYLEQLLAALRERGGIEAIEVANMRRRQPGGGGTASVRNLGMDLWWTTVELPRRARAVRADVIHHPLPGYSVGTRIPQVVTVHDLAFERLPDEFDRRFALYAHHTHRAAAKAAAAVITVSETTADDVRTLWGVPSARIVVARHGPGQPLEPVKPVDPTYFLYVGDDEPRKNLGMLIAAYGRYREATETPAGLVLAGAVHAYAPGVTVETAVSRQRLAELYAGAIALVHPSLYEGFGLTPLEAMAAGAPVLAANVPGVREVCGEAARYADPHDAASFAVVMAELAADPAARRELAERGRKRAGCFSWAAAAEGHVAAYSLAVNQR